METTRREFIQSSGLAAVGTTLASSLAGTASARAQSDSSSFDIDKEFAAFMRDLGGSAEDAGGRVLFTGRDPISAKPFPAGRLHGNSRHCGRRGGRGHLARPRRPGAGTQHRLAPGPLRHCALGAFPRRLQHRRGHTAAGLAARRMDLGPDGERPEYPGALPPRQPARLPGVRDQGRPAGHPDRHLSASLHRLSLADWGGARTAADRRTYPRLRLEPNSRRWSARRG